MEAVCTHAGTTDTARRLPNRGRSYAPWRVARARGAVVATATSRNGKPRANAQGKGSVQGFTWPDVATRHGRHRTGYVRVLNTRNGAHSVRRNGLFRKPGNTQAWARRDRRRLSAGRCPPARAQEAMLVEQSSHALVARNIWHMPWVQYLRCIFRRKSPLRCLTSRGSHL